MWPCDEMGSVGQLDPRRGRLACQARIASGRQAGERPNVRSGAGAWPRATYADHVARLMGTPLVSRKASTSAVVHQSVGSSGVLVSDITVSVRDRREPTESYGASSLREYSVEL
jgi:hypothetical protein